MKFITGQKESLAVALGRSIPVDYFLRVATTTIRKNPLVAQCTPMSVMACLMDLAQTKLCLDSFNQEAHLVPFWNNKAGCYEAQLMIGYRGYLKLLRKNVDLINVSSEVVYSRDKFIYRKGSGRALQHEPALTADRGEPIGAYAYFAYKDGGEDFEFIPSSYIERVKAAAHGTDKPDSPWNKWGEGMWKKTAIKQLTKLADISPQVEEALSKDLDYGAIDVEARIMPSTEVEPSKLTGPEQAPEPAKPAPAPAARQDRPAPAPTIVPKPPPAAAPQPASRGPGRPPKPAPPPPSPPPPPAPEPEPKPEPEPEQSNDGWDALPLEPPDGWTGSDPVPEPDPVPPPPPPPPPTGRQNPAAALAAKQREQLAKLRGSQPATTQEVSEELFPD